MIKRYIIYSALISLLFISYGCGGGGGGEDAPAGSTITVNPSSITYDSISGDTIQNISVVVKNEDAILLNNVELFISGPFAEPRVPARYQFYKKFDAADPVDSGFTAVTNQNGVYEFSIKIYAFVGGSPSAFLDSITIHAQSAFSTIVVSLGQQ
jgi:hypothetical protein